MKLFKTLTFATALSLSLSAQAAPLFNLFELGVQAGQEARYNQIGEHNIRTSIAQEKGTLAMYALADAANPNLAYMVELYADEAAYQTHIQSAQYQAFLQASPQILTEHKRKIELVAQFLQDKKVAQTADIYPNLVIIDVKPEFAPQFQRIVRNEMQQSLNSEDGVLAMYAATEKNEPNRWYFFEIYQNESAYRQHRASAHFQTYLNDTAEMLNDKRIIPVVPIELGNQGGLAVDTLSEAP